MEQCIAMVMICLGGTHQKCSSQIRGIWKQIGDALVWPVTSCAALVSGVSKCASVVIRCEGRIRRDPCDERHEMSTPALWTRLQLLPPSSYKYENLLISKLSILPKPVTIFSDAPTQRGIWVFQDFGFTRLSDFQGNWVFTAFGQILLRFHDPAYAIHPQFTFNLSEVFFKQSNGDFGGSCANAALNKRCHNNEFEIAITADWANGWN